MLIVRDQLVVLLLFLTAFWFTFAWPGETESGSAGTQPDKG